jgi:hypothetical protein
MRAFVYAIHNRNKRFALRMKARARNLRSHAIHDGIRSVLTFRRTLNGVAERARSGTTDLAREMSSSSDALAASAEDPYDFNPGSMA